MTSTRMIQTMSVDVTLTDVTREPRNTKLTRVELAFIGDTSMSFIAADKHLRKVVTELDAYLKSKGE